MKVYFVAGEPSGDLLASGLMAALVRRSPGIEFRGVGGESMAALGLESRFDISKISVMGFFEVLPRLPLILKRIRQTADDICRYNPDVIVTVDSWGFVSALLTKLRKRKSTIPVVHYVAPQVWAWKKGRAKNVARLVDRLLTLLPYEGQYFEKYGLKCDFVGHPVIERMTLKTQDTDFRSRHGIPEDALLICALPGSRRSEVSKLIPILKDAIGKICKSYDNIFVIVPTVAGVEQIVREKFSDLGVPVKIVTGADERYGAFTQSRIALAASGTVSLELTAVGTPHLILYTFSPMTNRIVKHLIKAKYANLINIVADRPIVSEFVLDNCRADLIAESALKLLDNKSEADQQIEDAQQILQKLRLPDILPSDRAAQIVLEAASC